ncbi:hypothetical protein B0H11DRAFT_1901684 [Mycena galericulata]|nr:hypothetical protein B0H11DRAFT_1901684 [Mycena galericulata]
MRMVDKMREGRVFIPEMRPTATVQPADRSSIPPCRTPQIRVEACTRAERPRARPPPRHVWRRAHPRHRTYAEPHNGNSSSSTARAPPWTAAHSRGGDLNMLGINYPGGSIINEDGGAAMTTKSAYAKAEGGARVQATYRAPDAPDAPERIRVESADAPTTLFTVFRMSFHEFSLNHGANSILYCKFLVRHDTTGVLPRRQNIIFCFPLTGEHPPRPN